jgi:hypothetical protein
VHGRSAVVAAALVASSGWVDLLYAAGPTGTHADASSEATFDALLRAATQGTIPRRQLEASYARIIRLKARFH